VNKCIAQSDESAIGTEGIWRSLFSRGLVIKKNVMLSVGGARVMNVIRARIAKMHNACLRNCQRCASMYEAASLHLFVLRGAQSRFFVYACARELYLRRLDDESSHVRFDKDLRARYRNAICETLVRRTLSRRKRVCRALAPRDASRRAQASREITMRDIITEQKLRAALFRVRKERHVWWRGSFF